MQYEAHSFGFLAQTITIAWYQLHGNPETDLTHRRRQSPWYRQKTTVSYTDMLAALRRELIRHEYRAQAPTATTSPQITPAPSRSALMPPETPKVEVVVEGKQLKLVEWGIPFRTLISRCV